MIEKEERPKLPQGYQNRVNNAQGHDFESAILRGCAIYAAQGIAYIEKTPEPFRVTSKSKSGGIFQGRFTARAQSDFQGTVGGGRSIVFEAKYTTTDRLRWDVLTEKQREALERHQSLGALALVCVGIQGGFFAVPWSRWKNMKQLWGRRYVTANDLEPCRVKFDGAVRFLEYVHTNPSAEAAGGETPWRTRKK